MSLSQLPFIDNSTFASCLQKLALFPKSITVAVAVSGGSDSLCLTFLLNNWAQENSVRLKAIIVDHKLRNESTQEAQLVSEYLKENNIETIILARKDSIPASKIQEIARKDRYQLLKNYCFNHGIVYLFVAHHKDDQLETYLFRHSKGKNLVGNAGMTQKQVDSQVIVLRPLLNFTKNQLINTLKNMQKTWWVEDPSNNNTKYTRILVRKHINNLTKKEKQQLEQEQQQYINQRIDLEKQLLDFLAKAVTIDYLGLAKIDLLSYKNCSINLQLMVIRIILKFIAQDYYSINLTKARNLVDNILHNKKRVYTVGKCIIKIKKHLLIIFKEPKHVKNITEDYDNYLWWDNRFIINKTLASNNIIAQNNPKFTKKTKKGYILSEYDNYFTQERDFLYTLPLLEGVKGPLICYNGYQCLMHYYAKKSLVTNIFYA